MEGKRQVLFRVSNELLHELLKLPADVKVTGFSHDKYFLSGEYAIRCESESFPVTHPCCAYPEVSPQYRATEVDGVRVAEFVGWLGLPADADTPHVAKEV